MSDFIYSTKIIDKRCMRKALLSIYEEKLSLITYLKGTWGSLGITKNIYNGYDPYETAQYIVVVIGGPLLTFKENEFIQDENSNAGTKAIFERWTAGEMKWDEDLNGPFSVLIIDKEMLEVICVTDIMSFIPIYEHYNYDDYTISSHVDMLSIVESKSSHFDEVSLADFILNGTVTYPYTMFKDIYQIQPASRHIYSHSKKKVKVESYWRPYETNEYSNIKKTASFLRESLNTYISLITSQTTNIAQFLSGGEDSRTISGLLKNIERERDAYIYLDNMNREGKIGRKIAKRYNANFKLTTREEMHYLNVMEKCIDLVGSGAEYHHAHTYGFHEKLKKYDAVFGGLFSDALLKGARIKKTKLTQKFIFLPNRKEKVNLINNNLNSSSFSKDIMDNLKARRIRHLKFIKEYRKESAEEWFELWPSSMNRNIPNLHANRRLFKSYEPFLSNEIVKVSAGTPQRWKLNRKLFHKTSKPYLTSSKWILHGDGWYPYFSFRLNSFISFFTWAYRQTGKRLGLIRGNQGSWARWKHLINNPQWDQQVNDYFSDLTLTNEKFKDDLKKFASREKYSVLQYIAFTQVLYQLQKRYKNEEKS